jgi:hypothetical protein
MPIGTALMDSTRMSVWTNASPPLAIVSSLPLVRTLPKKIKFSTVPPLAPARLHHAARLHRAVYSCAADPLTVAASTDLTSHDRLHRADEPTRRMLQQADKGGELRVKPSCRAP